MLEKLKAEVLLAYQELNKYGLNKYARGIVSAIDRESGLIVMKSDRAALVADMQGNILEGVQSIPSDIQSHIAIYQAFPQLGGVVRPHARYATIFAQVGMDIPVLGTFHKDRFQVEIPCASSAMEIRDTFHERSIDPQRTPAALLVSHSAYAWDQTALEETAYLAYQTMQLNPGIQPLQ